MRERAARLRSRVQRSLRRPVRNGAGAAVLLIGATALLAANAAVAAAENEIYPAARCDGVTDDTAALQAWLDRIANGRVLRLPAGTCVFRSTLHSPPGSFANVTIRGSGYYTSVLEYAGADTGSDLIRIGSGNLGDRNAEAGWTLSGFRITSRTRMTGGAGIHFWHLTQSVVDIVIDGQGGTGDLWNGAWFDEVDVVSVPYVAMRAQHDVLLVNGSRRAEPWWPNYVSGIRLGAGKIGSEALATATSNGIHLAGGVGGLSCEAVDVIGNRHNLLVDTAITGTGNQGDVFGSGCFFDTSENGGDNVLIDDASGPGDAGWMGGTKALEIDGSIATCAAACLDIRNWHNGSIHIGSYQIAAAKRDGVIYRDATAALLIGSLTSVDGNGGYGINALPAVPAIALADTRFAANRAGDFSPSVLRSALPLSLADMPCEMRLAIGGSTEGVTSVARSCRYALHGDEVSLYFDLRLSDKGGRIGALTLTGLPVASAAAAGQSGGGGLTDYDGWIGLEGIPTLTVAPNSTTVRVGRLTSAGLRPVTDKNLGQSTMLAGWLRYRRR